MKKPKVIIVMPAYNAEKTVESVFKKIPKDYQNNVVLFDDASHDNTYKNAKQLGINAHRNPINLGYGGNLKSGLLRGLKEGADIIIELHPDGEYDPSAIVPAIEKVRKGADLVLGNRFFNYMSPLNSGMYFWKYIPIIALSLIDTFILGVKVHDLHQGFRLFTRNLLNNINFKNNSNNYLFSFEIIAQAKFKNMKIVEVPIACHYDGKKRGASLKNSIIYTLGTFKILLLYKLAKIGIKNRLFS